MLSLPSPYWLKVNLDNLKYEGFLNKPSVLKFKITKSLRDLAIVWDIMRKFC